MSKHDRRAAQNVRLSKIARFAENRGFDGAGLHRSDIGMSEIRNELGYRLSEKELALIGEDADGRLSPARAAFLSAQSITRTERQHQWTPRLVKARLKEAARGIERYVRKPGPAQKLGFWPQTSVEWEDLVAQAGSEALLMMQEARNSAGGDRDISRIEQAILWPLRYLADDGSAEERMAVSCWMGCEARRESFSQQYVELGCSWATARRRRDAGFETISGGLKRDGLRP